MKGDGKRGDTCFVENLGNEARNPIAFPPDAFTLAIDLWENLWFLPVATEANSTSRLP
jgi:hypothetical protein